MAVGRTVAGISLVAALASAAVALPHASGQAVQTVPLEQSPMGVTVDGATNRAFVTTSDIGDVDRVLVLDTTTGAILNTIQTGVGPYPLSASLDERSGRVLVVDQNSNRVSTLNAATGALLRSVPVGQSPTAVAVDGSTGRAFVVNTASSSVSVIDTRSGALLRTIPLPATPSSVAVDTRNGHAFVGAYNGSITMIDARSGAIMHSHILAGGVTALGVDERAGRVLATSYGIGYNNNQVNTFDASSGQFLRSVSIGQYPGTLTVDSRLGRAIVVDESGTMVSVFSTRSGALLHTTTVAQSPGLLAVDAPTGRIFVVGQYSDSITMLNARTGGVMRTITLGRRAGSTYDWVDAVAVDSHDGRLFIASDYGSNARIHVLDGRSGAVLSTVGVRVSPLAIDEQAGRAAVAGSPLPAHDAMDTIWSAVAGLLNPALSHLCPWCATTTAGNGTPSNVTGGVSLVDMSK